MTERLERRRSARTTDGLARIEALLPLNATVRVLDISESGMLLTSPQALTVGSRGHVRLRLGADPMTLHLEVRRVVEERQHGTVTYRLGTDFVAMDEETRNKIERFLRDEV